MSLRRISSIAGLVLMVGGASVQAGDPAAGAQKAKEKACVTCHGEDGLGIDPTYPKLAGQYADYMVHALRSYKNGGRKNAIMGGLVGTLTETDMADISAYYAEMSGLNDLTMDVGR